jgi:hypothetical protein
MKHCLPVRTALAAAIVIALGSAPCVHGASINAAQPDVTRIEAAAGNPALLVLRSGVFDPTAQQLDFAGIGAAGALPSAYAIVQFRPGQLDARKDLVARGVEVLGYVPNNAYTVRLPGNVTLASIARNPAVRWAGTLEPGMKLDPALWLGKRFDSRARQGDGSYEVRVDGFAGVDSARIAAALEKLVPGVRITMRSERPEAMPYVRAAVAPSQFDALLTAATSIEGVASVTPWVQTVTLNSGAIGAIQGNDTSACPGSGPVCGPTPIWDHGIFGSGQIIATADSGTTPNEAWFTTLDQGAGPHVDVTFSDSPPPVLPAIGTLHPDNKIIGYWLQPNGPTDYDYSSGHGTHTSGTLVGDAAGTFGATTYLASTPLAANHELADGMAPNAQLLEQDAGGTDPRSIFVTDLEGTLQQAYAGGARIHSDSWGSSDNGAYVGDDRAVDHATRKLENLLFVVAAGNDGPGGGSIGSPGNAKNALTVGALGHAGSTSVAGYSSRGPTADGRQKPDIMAPGTSTISALATGTVTGTPTAPLTTADTGTSMATPTIAGNAALLRQFFTDGFYPRGQATAADVLDPTGADMKAILLNGTNPLQTGWPNANSAWGRAWLDGNLWFNSTLAGGDDSRRLRLFERTNAAGLETGDVNEYGIANVGAGAELRATLTWFDPPAIDGVALTLVNNLDLEVVDPNGVIYKGNVLTGGVSTPGGSADALNTVEQVRFDVPVAGSYTFRVNGTNVPGDGSVGSERQGYALAVSGDFGLPDQSAFAAPTGLAVAGNDTTGVAISFSDAGGAQGFQLYRAEGTCATAAPGDFHLVGNAPASPVADDTTQGGYSYAYKVRGISNDVEGEVSACIDVVSQDDCTVHPDFDLQSLVGDGSNASCSVDLTWSPAQDGCPLSSGITYTVIRDTDPYFGNPQTLTDNATTPSFTDTGVTDGTPYYYRVSASDSFDNGTPLSRLANVTPSGADGPDPTTFLDDVDTHTYMSMQTPWQITNTAASAGTFSYHNAGDNQVYPDNTCASIETPPLTIMPGATTLDFMAKYDMEYQWDGAVLEISTDGGNTWNDLPPDGGYPSSFAQTLDPPINGCGYPASHGAFNGVSTANSDADPGNGSATAIFKPFSADLSSYVGQTVEVRWTMSSDPATGFSGFFLDQVAIGNVALDVIFADGFDPAGSGGGGGDYMCQ